MQGLGISRIRRVMSTLAADGNDTEQEKFCTTIYSYKKSVVCVCLMKKATGKVDRGDKFFDRQGELGEFWRALETDNLLKLAPCRSATSTRAE